MLRNESGYSQVGNFPKPPLIVLQYFSMKKKRPKGVFFRVPALRFKPEPVDEPLFFFVNPVQLNLCFPLKLKVHLDPIHLQNHQKV